MNEPTADPAASRPSQPQPAQPAPSAASEQTLQSAQQQSAQPQPEAPTAEALMHILAEIRPMIQMDGGDIEFVEFKPEDGEVHIRMAGACVGCPASSMTLKMGIEQAIQERFPDLEVVAVA